MIRNSTFEAAWDHVDILYDSSPDEATVREFVAWFTASDANRYAVSVILANFHGAMTDKRRPLKGLSRDVAVAVGIALCAGGLQAVVCSVLALLAPWTMPDPLAPLVVTTFTFVCAAVVRGAMRVAEWKRWRRPVAHS